MKLVGYRHKDSTDCVWLAPTQDAADRMLKSWLTRLHSACKWEERFEHFEEIEADLEYTEVS